LPGPDQLPGPCPAWKAAVVVVVVVEVVVAADQQDFPEVSDLHTQR
jgi:hypothetical protein